MNHMIKKQFGKGSQNGTHMPPQSPQNIKQEASGGFKSLFDRYEKGRFL